MDWHLRDITDCLADLKADPVTGLTSADVHQRLATHGCNELQDRGGTSTWRILWEQFTSTMALILIAAAFLSAVVGSYKDTITILAIVILFALLGFYQEYRAEQAMRALKKLAVPSVRVRREGVITEIPAVELVSGDIILLESGNLVPADCRVIESFALRAQESLLTGEAAEVEKSISTLVGENLSIGDRNNMLYMGTMVSYGRGIALVVATGMNTELGRIAELLQQVKVEWTPLQRRLDQLGKVLAILSVVIAAVIFVLGMLRGENLREMLMTAVSVAVAAIPEGLPAVVTITLAIGAQRMLRKRALIRKLPAVETLGSVTVICSDKTGTLTQNRMTVTDLLTASELFSAGAATVDTGQERKLLLVAVCLCNDSVLKGAGQEMIGDPTETALLVAAAGEGLLRHELEAGLPRSAEIPFDSKVKRMVTIHDMADSDIYASMGFTARPASGQQLVVAKGALDAVMELCDHIAGFTPVRKMDTELRQLVEDAANRLAAQGKRVLAVACGLRLTSVEDIHGLGLIGLVAMMDPPRAEARAAVASCKSAGIRVVMITGDHPLTARSIAQEVGIDNGGRVITGSELDVMGVEGLAALVGDVSMFARVSPEHKLLIVGALQQQGAVVAMTGDGVNDAPALKKADIGVAMGAVGTDVARAAADMVLLDDNFATIVAAVEEGRTIYDNIRKFIVFSVSGNMGKILAVLLLPFMGLPNPLTPLQLLWLNLLTDGLLGLGMGMERPEPDVMGRSPISGSSGIFDRPTIRRVILTGLTIGLSAIVVAWYFWRYQYLHPTEQWQSVLFTSLACAQIGQAMALRSFRHSLFRMGVFTNPLLLIMAGCVVLLQGAAIYLPVLQPWFRTAPLSGHGLIAALMPGVVVFVVLEVEKFFSRIKPCFTT
jgi:Ca2+-transporting ATPase